MNTYGLLGEKLGHSLSPQIHKLILEYAGLEGEYKLFPSKKEEIEELLNQIKSGRLKGLNVTIPYKLEVMKYLDVVSEEASYIGAVNTICLKKGKLAGFNTDSIGFKNTLVNNGIEVKNKNIAVLGSGGASKAVTAVLESMGAAKTDIISRNPSDIQKGYDELYKNQSYHILINATPVGMHPKTDESPVEKEALRNVEAVVDLIYNPTETKLLYYAKELSVKNINGMYMLVSQAVKAQEIFNDIKIGEDIMQKIYKKMAGNM